MDGRSNDIPFNSYSIDLFGALGRAFSDSGTEVGAYVATAYDWFVMAWSVIAVVAFILSVLLLFAIIYTYLRAAQLDEAQSDFLAQAEEAYRELYGTAVKNARWSDVEAHIASDNPNDWKLAIIEADVLLAETLDGAGFPGMTIAEQLQGASPQSFTTLDAAWRAHRMRNQIAHSGTDFVLTQRAAQETITQYRMVFEEFGVL